MSSENLRPSTPPHPVQRFRSQFRNWRGIAVTVPIVTGFVLALRFLGLLQPIEWAALDKFFQLRSPESPDSRIVIVGISETDIQTLQQIPLSDRILAKLLTKIKQQQPRAIGLDLYRDIRVEPGYGELTKVFETTPNLIGIEKVVGDESNPPVPPPLTLKRLGQVGMNDIVPDNDGKIRRALLILTLDDETWIESLGLKLAQLYLAKDGITPNSDSPYLQFGQAKLRPFQANDGGYVQADDAGYQALINFRNPAYSFPIVSVTDVLAGRVDNLLHDRIVLIGATAPSLKDLFYTPFSSSWSETPEQMTGVEIQANIASQIINAALAGRPLIQTLPEPIEWLWIALWSGVGAILVKLCHKPQWSILGLVLAGSTLIGLCFFAFDRSGWWFPVVPAGFALISSFSVLSYSRAAAHQKTQVAAQLFFPYQTPLIPNQLNRDQNAWLKEQMQGKKITATVLSIGIQNLEHIMASLDSQEVLTWLGDYTQAITPHLLKHQGVVDHWSGNTVIATFGILTSQPSTRTITQSAQQALQCALALPKVLEPLNQSWQSQGCPPAIISMGIATGDVVVGTLNSNGRSGYIIVGEAINTASWLQAYRELHNELLHQSLNGSTPQLLVNETTYHLNHKPTTARLIQTNHYSDTAFYTIPIIDRKKDSS